MNFISPVTWKYKISSVLGDPRPYGGHEGVDLSPDGVSGNLPVVAAAAGTVIESGYMADGYGYWVKLQHADGFQTIYGHFSGASALKKGDTVAQGQYLGNAGSTGYSTGTHLHFSIVENGTYLDPVKFFTGVSDMLKGVMDSLQDLLPDGPPAECGSVPSSLESDAFTSWVNCVKTTLTPEGAIAFQEKVDKFLGNQASMSKPGQGGIIDLQPLIDFLSGLVEDLIEIISSGVTWPIRAYVNALKLSDPALEGGKDTIEWLKLPENQRLYLASSVALILAIVFTLLALNSFLGDPGGKVINVAVPQVAAVKAVAS